MKVSCWVAEYGGGETAKIWRTVCEEEGSPVFLDKISGKHDTDSVGVELCFGRSCSSHCGLEEGLKLEIIGSISISWSCSIPDVVGTSNRICYSTPFL